MWLRVTFNRVNYNFTKENNRILDIRDQKVINHIFSLPNSSEFEAVMEDPKEEIISKEEKVTHKKKSIESKKEK